MVYIPPLFLFRPIQCRVDVVLSVSAIISDMIAAWNWLKHQCNRQKGALQSNTQIPLYIIRIIRCILWARSLWGAKSWLDDSSHDDVIKWKHFARYWPFVRGIHRSPVNSQHKGQWRGALIFSLIYTWINGWVNNREAGDRGHYDVTVMVIYFTVDNPKWELWTSGVAPDLGLRWVLIL